MCDICHKNEATIHMQEIHGSEKKTLNICSECAAAHKIVGSDMDGLNLAEILYNLSSQMLAGQGHGEDEQGDPDNPQDPMFPLFCGCGWNTAKFRETGRLGCAECYDVFAPLLKDAIASMHKGAAHLGKVPPGGEGATALEGRNRAFELATLKARLDAYVREEEYEKAAKVRDDIRKLKAEMEKAEKTRSKKRKGGRGKKSG